MVHYTKGEAATEASAEAAVEASGDASAEATAHFTDIGLPKSLKHGLQPTILKAVWLTVTNRVAYQYFGQHAAVLCMSWLIAYSGTSRSPDLAKLDEQIPDLEPYLHICGGLLSPCLSSARAREPLKSIIHRNTQRYVYSSDSCDCD